MRVLICDDKKDGCEDATHAVKTGAPDGTVCTSLHSGALRKAWLEFFDAIGPTIEGKRVAPTKFDGYDIIILDNNLTHLEIKGARQTAENIAGYIRAITDTPYVVSLNKNVEVDFDLRFLVGDYATRADLALNTRHLANRALWTGVPADAEGDFNPWYWPALSRASERRRNQIAFTTANLDKPILRSLGFPNSAAVALSRHAKGVLSPEASADESGGRPIGEITFREFFRHSPRSLSAEEERTALLDAKSDTVIGRVVAGELEAWLRRDVLGPQDVLVDTPHLLLRLPFLLGESCFNNLDSWNASAAGRMPPFGIDAAIFKEHVQANLFAYDMWLSSPAFWWPPLKDNEKLNELFFKPDVVWGDFIFCEDTSRFVVRSERDEEHQPVEFAAEYEGSWNRRYVARVAGYKYAPLSRLAM
jgi:hypothetical protein